MLTVLRPELMPAIRSFAGGLLPFFDIESGKLSLVIKGQKEAILAARMNGGFAFYLAPLKSTSGLTVSLITAFFDDEDEPLTIASALFSDDHHTNSILELLTYDEIDIYFFDEHGREWMSYRATIADGGSCLIERTDFGLLSYHPETAKSVLASLQNWFGLRTPSDDARAIQVIFKETLAPDDIVILDATIEGNDYAGNPGFSHDSLTRDDPGAFQERDIAAGLRRAFKREQVAINPRRRDTHKEILDVMVVTDSHLLMIQAKDSPNTETSLKRRLDRKRRTSRSQLADALGQVQGAARFLTRPGPVQLVIGDENVNLVLGNRKLVGMVIIKELFDDEGAEYVRACEALSEISASGVVMDYPAFHAFSHHFASEQRFIDAIKELARRVSVEGKWVKPADFIMEHVLAEIEKIKKASAKKP